jgi:hypothetical protein
MRAWLARGVALVTALLVTGLALWFALLQNPG